MYLITINKAWLNVKEIFVSKHISPEACWQDGNTQLIGKTGNSA
jgi:hypothetical protein